MKMTDDLLYFIAKRITAEASAKAEFAGYAGAMGDDGATSMRHELETYQLGYKKEIPNNWTQHVKDFNFHKDPEFETYQRLKKKFGET